MVATADNVAITAGSGTVVATDEVNTGGGNAHVQLIKLLDGTDGGTERIQGTAANGLEVDVTRVTGNVTVVQGTGSNLNAVVTGTVGVTNTTASGLQAEVVGTVAHAAADSGKPIKIGGKANSTQPAAVASGQRVDAWLDLYGRQVVIPGHPSPLSAVVGASASGITTVIASGSTPIFVKKGSLHNRNATGTVVQLLNGSTTGSPVWRGFLASGGGGSLFDFGERGVQISSGSPFAVHIDTTGVVDVNVTEYYLP